MRFSLSLLRVALGLLLVMIAVAACIEPAFAGVIFSPGGAIALATVAPFATDPELIATSIAYKNQRLIADGVLPRKVVSKQEYKWYLWNIEEGFSIPDTKVGRKSQPNEVEFTAEEKTGATVDYGLDDPIPQADLDNAPTGVNPRARAVEGLTDLILLDREKRVAGKVFNANTYAATNKVTLAGSDQFSDPDSDPIATVSDALDVPLMRPNVMVIGRLAYTAFSRHPKVLQAVHRIGGATAGIAARQAIAEIFELEEILVGEAFLNTSKRGQTASMARVWGKHIALIYRDILADPTASGTSRPTFGFTAQWGSRVAGSERDSRIGLRGGERVRVGESVQEDISAPNLGYFLQNVVA